MLVPDSGPQGVLFGTHAQNRSLCGRDDCPQGAELAGKAGSDLLEAVQSGTLPYSGVPDIETMMTEHHHLIEVHPPAPAQL